MRIAIIGSGISGLTAAYLLSQKHQVTVYEANDRLGGHTATETVQHEGQVFAIDTGFIVYNDWTYPNFIRLLDRLGVASQPSDMGFSAFYADGRFEYAGNDLNTLFSDRRTLGSVKHWGMLKDIVRFNRQAIADWRADRLDARLSLKDYLAQHGYGEAFRQRYLIPMGSAIWSSSTGDMQAFPARFFIQFFYNHGLLNIVNRPQWRVVKGGSREYLKPLTALFADRIRLSDPVHKVVRAEDGVSIESAQGIAQYDQVVFACHSDQALKILGKEASEAEQAVLGTIHYRNNEVALHTDEALLPSRRRTWSSWNYCLQDDPDQLPVLTYNMNILQGLKSSTQFCVTLNATDRIDPTKVLGLYQYAHPVFTQSALQAQARWHEISGVQHTAFCGAYWFNGFHEDGVKSALRVAESLGAGW